VCKQYKEKVGKEEAEEKKEKKQEGEQSAASLKKRRIVREKNASVTQVKTEIAAHGVEFSGGVFQRGFPQKWGWTYRIEGERGGVQGNLLHYHDATSVAFLLK